MIDEMLIQHCAPTLAGLKTGNMFNARFKDKDVMMRTIRSYNKRLKSKGVQMLPLRYRNGNALLYVFRPKMLEKDLSHFDAQSLLKEHGYDSCSCAHCIREIIRRLENEPDFPHEIGLLLSYPPEDVRGFIEQRAGNCKTCGFWKVYGDPEDAEKTFSRFERCTEHYRKSWASGRGLESLTVMI